MRAHLQRQGVPVARPAPIPCRHPLAAGTVERIMRHNGWRGVMRARRPPRTTEPDPAARRAPDLVGRRWRVAAPNLLEVADFTYVPLGTGGFGYTAFVVDAYAGLIPGWECSNGQRHRIRRAGVTPRGSLPVPTRLSVRPHNSSQRCRKSVHRNTLRRDADAGRTDRIDRHRRRRLDNALCETTIGLYKTECLRPGSPSRTGPIRTLADLENMTSAWVSWYNTTRLMHRLGRIPPAEAEACAFRSGVERSDRGDASDHRFAGISYVMHRGCFAGTFRDACRRNDRAHRSGIRWWFRGCEIQRTPGQSSTQPTSRPQFPNEMHCAPGRASSQHRFCHVQALSFACPAGWTQGARRHAA